jgi:hypothetical protein
MEMIRRLKFSAIIMGSVAAAGLLAVEPAQAQNPVGEVLGTAAAIAGAPFAWGGHNYCWYEGWNGPGWYWCGYGARRGYGWGGGEGWHGWHRGGHGGHMGGGHMDHGHGGGHMGGGDHGHGGGHEGGHEGGHGGDHH